MLLFDFRNLFLFLFTLIIIKLVIFFNQFYNLHYFIVLCNIMITISFNDCSTLGAWVVKHVTHSSLHIDRMRKYFIT